MSIARRIRAVMLVLGSVAALVACGSAPAITEAPTTAATTAAVAPTTAADATSAPTTAAASESTSVATAEATGAATSEATTAATTDATSATTGAATSEATSAASTASGEPYTFGMVLVGPINDGGWNQANYEAAKYVESKVPGAKLVYVDKVNPADRPNVKVEQVVDDLISQGAKFIITDSDDFKDGTVESAKAHPDVYFVHTSGDSVLAGNAPPNLSNIMGRMEYGNMIGGCAAALQTKTGNISFLGPLINDETRRLVNSAYLGARHCWEKVLNKPAADLKFNVTWIGFWFNIPGVTLDPTKVSNDFISAGSDVLMSGIDTTEALVEANKATQAGKEVYAVAYDYKDGCKEAVKVCLGVPYFNWGPAYVKALTSAQNGAWKSTWDWNSPDWKDLNNPDTGAVGWVSSEGLSQDNQVKLNDFIKGLGDGTIDLFKGPLKFQDGTDFLTDGQKADDKQIWYMPQLLQGVTGQSAPQ